MSKLQVQSVAELTHLVATAGFWRDGRLAL
jgi:hypothetical protein